ncbi:MAG: hypothetical protein FWH18_02550 [Marinilabiliaceae bacterium]|nr:hypothetical protein [Marinilabiliaceae bacterium]
MANRLACFSFSNEEKYEIAKKDLFDRFYSDYSSSDKIYFYGRYGDEYVLYIYDECSDIAAICNVCIAAGGKRMSANYGY